MQKAITGSSTMSPGIAAGEKDQASHEPQQQQPKIGKACRLPGHSGSSMTQVSAGLAETSSE
jgi:hypothetical protein